MLNSVSPRSEPKSNYREVDAAVINMLRGGDRAIDVNINIAPIARSSQPDRTLDIAIEDCNDLLNAVTARLRLTVGTGLSSIPMPHLQLQNSASQVQTNILECAMALEQLHMTLTHEFERRQELELEVFDAKTALAQSRAELVGTQAGERRALHLALHDNLTSLPNQSFFRERLDHALTRAMPQRQALAVMYLDLDGFKPINDTHGHAAGDELLRIISARLARTVRAEDMVSRLGGDEFACLLDDFPSREQLNHLAGKLFDAVSAPCKIGQLELTVRPSIGIAMCPTDGTTTEALLKNADAAMFHAKRHQTGYAFFDECAAVRSELMG